MSVSVSIIIVNYNTCTLLRDCLTSVYGQTSGISYEVIVSDNGSADGSLEMLRAEFPQVKVIENGRNLGFGAANNRGLDTASGDFIFYLNSDTVLKNNAVKIFYDYWNAHDGIDSHLGALGTNLTDADGLFIHSGGSFPFYKEALKDLIFLNTVNLLLTFCAVFHVDGSIFQRKKPHPAKYTGRIDFVTGADLFVRNNSYARYDESFFLYSEDTYLQYCMSRAGLERRIIGGPQIVHLCGGSVGEKMSIERKASFSRIQFEYSRLHFLSRTAGRRGFLNGFRFFLCRMLIVTAWANPLILKKTAPHIVKIIRLQ